MRLVGEIEQAGHVQAAAALVKEPLHAHGEVVRRLAAVWFQRVHVAVDTGEVEIGRQQLRAAAGRAEAARADEGGRAGTDSLYRAGTCDFLDVYAGSQVRGHCVASPVGRWLDRWVSGSGDRFRVMTAPP